MSFKTSMKKVSKSIDKHSPEILIGLGIAGLVSTTVMAVKATPKALLLIEEKKQEKRKNGEKPELTPSETVKTTWKCYIPTVVSAGVSVACIVGSRSINAKRNAALATAYRISEATLSEYKDKMVEVVGEKKAQAIKDKVAQSVIDKHPVKDSEVLVYDDENDVLFYDPASGRYFRSTVNKVQKAVNNINERMISGDDYCSLNEFYEELHLDPTLVGDEIGFNVGLYGQLDISFSTAMAKNKEEPCIVMDYHIEPRYDYKSLH